ncbi:MAG: MarR family transcriptional regulator [Nanoarchaeota archaeon]
MEHKDAIAYGLIAVGAILIIILTLVKLEVDKQGVFMCEAVEMNPDLTMDDCPAHESPVSWLLFISFGVSLVILAGGLVLRLMPEGTTEQPATKKVDTSRLNPEESRIHTLLSEHEGSMYQSDLIKETGMSKVKTTRLLDKMESKGIIERKRRGMTNIIVLK